LCKIYGIEDLEKGRKEMKRIKRGRMGKEKEKDAGKRGKIGGGFSDPIITFTAGTRNR